MVHLTLIYCIHLCVITQYTGKSSFFQDKPHFLCLVQKHGNIYASLAHLSTEHLSPKHETTSTFDYLSFFNSHFLQQTLGHHFKNVLINVWYWNNNLQPHELRNSLFLIFPLPIFFPFLFSLLPVPFTSHINVKIDQNLCVP